MSKDKEAIKQLRDTINTHRKIYKLQAKIIKGVNLDVIPSSAIKLSSEMSKLTQVTTSLLPMMNKINNIIKNMHVQKINFNASKIQLYALAFQERDEMVRRFTDEVVFMPIDYLVKNDIYNLPNDVNMQTFLESDSLKKYYIEKMELWKTKYKDKDAHILINEIKDNFINNNVYSVSMLMFCLIECMLSKGYIEGSNRRYAKIKGVLKDRVFEPVGILDLYEEFIVNNLYANTEKAKDFSRHTTHGVNLELVNKKTMFNVVFIYDFIQSVLKVSE